MQHEKTKIDLEEDVNWTVKVFGWFLIVIVSMALILAATQAASSVREKASLPSWNPNKVLSKVPKLIQETALIVQYRDVVKPIDVKAIEAEGEKQALAKKEMVKSVTEKSGSGEVAATSLSPDDPDYMLQLEHDKWVWIINELEKQKAIRDAQMAHDEKVQRISDWLTSQKNSPYAYCAEYIVNEGDRTGVNPYLCVACGEAESTSGHACFHPFNAWGMGQKTYGSWEEGITDWFNNMLKHPQWSPWQTGWDMEKSPPYCETNQEEYATHVTGLVNSISGH